MTLDQKRNLIKSQEVIRYYIDRNKINDIDHFGSLLHDVETYLQTHGERNARGLKNICEISKINNIDSRNLLIKMIIDEEKNYVYLTEDDIRKIEGL